MKQLFKQIVKNVNQDKIDLKDYSALMDHMTKKAHNKPLAPISDGLNHVKEPVQNLEDRYRGAIKRPKIGAIEESQLEQSARNLQG